MGEIKYQPISTNILYLQNYILRKICPHSKKSTYIHPQSEILTNFAPNCKYII